MAGGRRANILIVDDDPGDVLLIKEGLAQNGLGDAVEVAETGQACLEKLDAGPVPDLVLLDLNMPGMNGLEVLAAIRGRDAWANVPVIVFTTSDAERDIVESYDLGANCFITKPAELDEFMGALDEVKAFWLDVATLPPRGSKDAS